MIIKDEDFIIHLTHHLEHIHKSTTHIYQIIILKIHITTFKNINKRNLQKEN